MQVFYDKNGAETEPNQSEMQFDGLSQSHIQEVQIQIASQLSQNDSEPGILQIANDNYSNKNEIENHPFAGPKLHLFRKG